MPLGRRSGGAEQVLLHFLEHGQSLGSSYVVFFLEDGPLVQEAQELGADVRVIDARRLRHLHRYALTVARLTRLISRERPDFVLSWMEKAHLYASPAAKAAGVPCAFHLPGFPSRWSWMDRGAKALPGRGVITVSDATAAEIEKLWPRRSVRIVRPGVDLRRFDPESLPSVPECRRTLGLPVDAPLIGTIVRLQRWKGAHVLIKAMPKVLESHPDARCVVIGGRHELERDYEPYLHRLVAELGLEASVRFVGFQPDLSLWRKALDVDVYASDREPFAVGILEGLAMANPVIAGDAGGTPEVIEDGVNGLLVPFGEEDPLAEAIIRVLSCEDFRIRLGTAGRESVRCLSSEAYARNMTRAVTELGGPW
jgi:glycosyltransferase involved in cell wall biosynthesis